MLSLSNTDVIVVIIVFVTLCSAEKHCTDDLGKTRRDGESWVDGCKDHCTCTHGKIDCVILCPTEGINPGCAIVKEVEDCCGREECLKTDMKDKKCDDKAAPGYQSVISPWTVRIKAGTGSKAKTCMGTIMNDSSIYVLDSCVGEKDTVSFLHPPPVNKTSAWSVTGKKKVSNMPNVRELVLADPGIDYQESLHEVNLPWAKFCKDKCQLFLTSFKPKGNGTTEYVLAQKADRTKCKLGAKDNAVLACLEILPASRPSCTNFDGSNVLVRIKNTYYLVGFLDGLSGKDKNGCDSNKDQYRKYVSTCSKLNLEN